MKQARSPAAQACHPEEPQPSAAGDCSIALGVREPAAGVAKPPLGTPAGPVELPLEPDCRVIARLLEVGWARMIRWVRKRRSKCGVARMAAWRSGITAGMCC
jgi:hypothetical protein